jgi:HK97 family phage prohead protease
MIEQGWTIPFETKAVRESDEAWTVTGYASVFGNTDLTGDVVMPGAFKKSLERHGLPIMLFNHKMEDATIGTIVDAKEDKRGLWFKAELPKDDDFVRGRIIPQLKGRGLKGVSIGYKTTEKEIRKSDGAKLLKQIRLYEISLTSLPANPLAEVETVKSLFADPNDPILTLETLADEMQSLARRVRCR